MRQTYWDGTRKATPVAETRNTPRLLTVAQVAAALQLSPWTLYQWKARGEGPPVLKIGNRVRYDAQAFAAWVEARAEERM